jgi:hypothetical protein
MLTLPVHYACSSCQEKFEFAFREASYLVGPPPVDGLVSVDDVLETPVRPAWCKDCGCVSLAEDIAPLRAFEDACGAVRSGRGATYPVFVSEHTPVQEALAELGAYMRWRLARRHGARALCCGGSNYQFMDVEQPLLKHAECEFGFVGGVFSIGSHCGPGPGVLGPANIRLYDAEGELIGLLTWRDRDQGTWQVEAMRYPSVAGD